MTKPSSNSIPTRLVAFELACFLLFCIPAMVRSGEPAGTIDLGDFVGRGVVLEGVSGLAAGFGGMASAGDVSGDGISDFFVSASSSIDHRRGVMLFHGSSRLESLSLVDAPQPGVSFFTLSDAMLFRGSS